jgi:hypothetical protein
MKANKGILIDPEKKEITEVTVESWREISKIIGNGCDIFTCPVEFPNGDIIYCDDEGCFHHVIVGIIMDGWQVPLVNRVLILGANDEGETIDAKTTIDWLKERIIFIDKEKAQKYAQFAAEQPFQIFKF